MSLIEPNTSQAIAIAAALIARLPPTATPTDDEIVMLIQQAYRCVSQARAAIAQQE